MQVSMSTATAGATIFYTESNSTPATPMHNGATPIAPTQVYNGPVNVPYPQTQNFKAIAYKAGMGDSVETQFTADNSGINSPQSANASGSAIVFSVWDGDWALLEEYGPENALIETYLQGYHGLVKTFVNIAYYYQDSLGSTSHIADASGALLESYRYDLYGKPTYWDASGGSMSNSAYGIVDLHGGARWIPELGLYDDRNRFMSPDLGRFLQPDPIGFKGDGSNLYRYCGNDWANRTDPMGLTDIYVDPEWDRLARIGGGISLSQGSTDGKTRMIIVEISRESHKARLKPQSAIAGEAKTTSRREADGSLARTGSGFTTNRTESAKPSPGYDSIGPTHGHLTQSGKPYPDSPDWSKPDRATARTGQIVWKINEDKPGELRRLTPQKEPGLAPHDVLVPNPGSSSRHQAPGASRNVAASSGNEPSAFGDTATSELHGYGQSVAGSFAADNQTASEYLKAAGF
jgi:RHS repeat-associated protein